ncbi:MAG: hypothetical protein IKZ06_00625, partial [Oscillospiraceae bacterium]|nr:hypothetical protein [Oscillospiraceae bacterium]
VLLVMESLRHRLRDATSREAREADPPGILFLTPQSFPSEMPAPLVGELIYKNGINIKKI